MESITARRRSVCVSNSALRACAANNITDIIATAAENWPMTVHAGQFSTLKRLESEDPGRTRNKAAASKNPITHTASGMAEPTVKAVVLCPRRGQKLIAKTPHRIENTKLCDASTDTRGPAEPASAVAPNPSNRTSPTASNKRVRFG